MRVWVVAVQGVIAVAVGLAMAGCAGTERVTRGAADTELTVASPDERVAISLSVAGGVPRYAVRFDGRPAVGPSRLGFAFGDGSRFEAGIRIEGIERRSFDETYTVPHGKASTIRNRYEERAVTLVDPSGRQLVVELRAYDDGAAFRYLFPARPEWRRIEIADELTEFAVAAGAAHWGLHLNAYDSPYEAEYDTGAVASIPDTTLMGLPALFHDRDTWLAVTEADLTDYAGMYLAPGPPSTINHDPSTRALRARLAPRRDDSGLRVVTAAPAATPWRAILLGDHPGRLVESNLVLNLNDPVAIDTTWIKPGLAIDDWMTDHTVVGEDFVGAMDNRTMKHYIDFCAEYGLEYMSIDAGWYGSDYMDSTLDLTRTIPEIDVPELVRYADERGVDIFLWTLGAIVKRQMDEAFAQFREWGVKGVNIDFLNADDQETVAFVNEATRKAAEYGLHVEFHGVYKPTGIERTYPNLLSHEAVLGLEYAKWSDLPTPEHNTIIPFTRMLAGPMDYLPGGFTNATRETFQIVSDRFMTPGTRAHALAQLVIFESAFQVLPDYPGNYRAKTGAEFLKHVPAAWDETRVLAGHPGDFIVIARRSGDAWFIGANADWTARTVDVPLDFLGAGAFTAEIYADGPNATVDANDVVVETRAVTRNDTLTIRMAPGGGMAGVVR